MQLTADETVKNQTLHTKTKQKDEFIGGFQTASQKTRGYRSKEF